jgi:hypothetical protein
MAASDIRREKSKWRQGVEDGSIIDTLGNYTFDTAQVVGAGQDNFVLTYDDGTGLISLEAAPGGGGGSPTPTTLYGFGELIGSTAFADSSDFDAMAALSTRDVATMRRSDATLQTRRFNGSSWSTVGNTFALAGVIQSITALSGSRVATFYSNSIRTLNFSSPNWSVVGNALALGSPNSYVRLAALDNTTIAVIRVEFFVDGLLATYSFDGTDWTQTGNALNIGQTNLNPNIAALSATRIAKIDGPSNIIAYDWDGTDWTQTGNALTAGIAGIDSVLAFNETDIMVYNGSAGGDDTFYMWRFDGTNWSAIGTVWSIAGGSNAAICAMSGDEFAWKDSLLDAQRFYRLPTSQFEPHSLALL